MDVPEVTSNYVARDIFNAGWGAYGFSLTLPGYKPVNPYIPGTESYSWWKEGWEAAANWWSDQGR